MATYINRNGKITAQVCIKPHRRAATFPTMSEAVAWAEQTEAHLRRSRAEGKRPHGKRVPLNARDVANLPRVDSRAFSGIYFLYRGDECVYVGQSMHVHSRAQAHMRGDFKTSCCDSYSWFPCAQQDLDRYETYFIEMLDPPLNVSGSPRVVRERIARELR